MNFLPEEDKKAVERQYRYRFITLFSAFILALAAINFVMIFPAFISVKMKNENLKNRVNAASNNSVFKNYSELDKSFQKLNSEANFLESRKKSVVQASDFFEDIINSRYKNITGKISITSVSFVSGAESGGARGRIEIRGNAETRDGLMQFIKNLKENGKFKNVESPASNILKSLDIDYFLTVILN